MYVVKLIELINYYKRNDCSEMQQTRNANASTHVQPYPLGKRTTLQTQSLYSSVRYAKIIRQESLG